MYNVVLLDSTQKAATERQQPKQTQIWPKSWFSDTTGEQTSAKQQDGYIKQNYLE